MLESSVRRTRSFRARLEAQKGRWRAGITLCVALLASTGPVHADAGSSSQGQPSVRRWSPYEAESVALALRQVGGQLESEPEGKIIGRIQVVRLEVFEPRDPAPTFLNWFHTTTKDYVVRREVLLGAGEPYSSRLAAETERNLRAFAQLSVVLVVPMRSDRPGEVNLLVVTKDVWSLRVSWEPQFRNGHLTALTLAPSEGNLLGTTQSVAAVLALGQNTYSLGGRYYVPRVGGSRVAAFLSANGIFNCRSGALEGGSGYFRYGQPLYSTLAKWSWQTAASWYSILQRAPGSSRVCSGGATSQRPWLVPGSEIYDGGLRGAPPSNVAGVFRQQTAYLFPDLLRAESLRGQVNVTRSYGTVQKLNLSLGAELDFATSGRPEVEFDPARARHYASRGTGTGWVSMGALDGLQLAPTVPPLRFPPVTESQFRLAYAAYQTAPYPTDRRISPYLQLRAFSTTYHRVINYNTLGLQEDIQVGHDVFLRVYPAFRPLSSRNMLGVFASASYTKLLSGGVVRALAAAKTEAATPGQSDVEVRMALHGATPDWFLGRWVSNVELTHRPQRYLQRTLPLGGDSVGSDNNYIGGGVGRLRGFLPSSFWSDGVLTINNELRSRPLRLWSVLFGVSVFHDLAASIYSGSDKLTWRHGGGAGLRFLAPQIDRDVFRIDVATPLGFPLRERDSAEFTVMASFGQAFGMPSSYPAVLLPE